MYYRGSWGTVCDDYFDNNAATVACRSLGYRSVHIVLKNRDVTSPACGDSDFHSCDKLASSGQVPRSKSYVQVLQVIYHAKSSQSSRRVTSSPQLGSLDWRGFPRSCNAALLQAPGLTITSSVCFVCFMSVTVCIFSSFRLKSYMQHKLLT